MDAWEAIAREEIRDVIARYNHAGDRGRLEELADCFTREGVMELPGEEPLRGRPAILAHLRGVVEDLAANTRRATLRHHVASVWIELEARDAARTRAYFSVYTEIGLDHWGVYRDRLLREEGAWHLAHRRVQVDGAVAGSRMLREPEAAR